MDGTFGFAVAMLDSIARLRNSCHHREIRHCRRRHKHNREGELESLASIRPLAAMPYSAHITLLTTAGTLLGLSLVAVGTYHYWAALILWCAAAGLLRVQEWIMRRE
jgi:hypothetical protein